MYNQNELEQVIKEGVFERDFTILNHKIRIRTLTSGESYDIMRELSGIDDAAKFSGNIIKTLARCIVSVDGKKIEYVSKNQEDQPDSYKRIKQNEEIISKWQRGTAEIYYEKFIELREDQQHFLIKSLTSLKPDGAEKVGKLEKPLE